MQIFTEEKFTDKNSEKDLEIGEQRLRRLAFDHKLEVDQAVGYLAFVVTKEGADMYVYKMSLFQLMGLHQALGERIANGLRGMASDTTPPKGA